MYVFIDLLKVLAAICITNSHFSKVWPISGIASGGMLGDIIFFAVSGYCLRRPGIRVKMFGKWYGRRIRRIYITVWIVGILTYVFVGGSFNCRDILRTFVYPTPYHFVASIMVLYIIYYFVMWVLERWKISTKNACLLYGGLVFVIYIFTFDKSTYHIDVVEEQFIRFLFLGAMLLGAYFKEKSTNNSEKDSPISTLKNTVICGITVIVYFVCKILISKLEILNAVQILTWITIVIALYFIFRWAEDLECRLTNFPPVMKSGIHSIAQLTLQIYLVQYGIIRQFENLIFPLNLIVIVAFILIVARLVWVVDQFVQKMIDKIAIKIRIRAICGRK